MHNSKYIFFDDLQINPSIRNGDDSIQVKLRLYLLLIKQILSILIANYVTIWYVHGVFKISMFVLRVLLFYQHIDYTFSRGLKTLCFIRYNPSFLSTLESLLALYSTLAKPTLEQLTHLQSGNLLHLLTHQKKIKKNIRKFSALYSLDFNVVCAYKYEDTLARLHFLTPHLKRTPFFLFIFPKENWLLVHYGFCQFTEAHQVYQMCFSCQLSHVIQ